MTKAHLVAIALTVAQAGCSLYLQPPPTPLPTRGRIDCDSNLAPPVVDGLGAIGAATIAGFVATRSGDVTGEADRNLAVAAVFGGVALAYIAAAIYGVNVSRWCDRAIDKMAERAQTRARR